ncbi:MAG: homocysteine S-methyltransferase family protein [Calditrichaeota bacterium]|nr:homocysteine S-methyltransferase family protein [Calditrichota bacterium]
MDAILLDGAMGTELQWHGLRTLLPLWSAHALIKAPDLVRQIHQEYVEAGAQVLTANTFRTAPYTLAKADMHNQAEELSRRAVQLAREAAGSAPANQGVRVAGSMAPLEDCYRPDLTPPNDILKREHRNQARHLANAGVDILLVETQNSIREACIATEMALGEGRPVWVSLIPKDAKTLFSGEPLQEAVRAVADFQPEAILVNCCPPPVAREAVEVVREVWDGPIGAYPNFGLPQDETESKFSNALSPAKFAEWGAELLYAGAHIVGGCCGTRPAHIAELSKIMRMSPLNIGAR